jgi:ribonuclease-3
MLKINIHYQFNNLELLNEALTHKSFSIDQNKYNPHNERLEFLGDSILNFIIAESLMTQYPQEPEGFLSKKRASLVNQNTLAQIAKGLRLQDHLQFGPGEVKQGSPLNPRILASALEAVIGAIYLDSNFAVVKKWLISLFENIQLDQNDQIGFTADYKTRLQELTQKYKLGTLLYEVILISGPSHKPHFLVSLRLDEKEKARAEGASKKIAEQKAAEFYLTELLKTLDESKKGERP